MYYKQIYNKCLRQLVGLRKQFVIRIKRNEELRDTFLEYYRISRDLPLYNDAHTQTEIENKYFE